MSKSSEWRIAMYLQMMALGQSFAYVTKDGIKVLRLEEIIPHGKGGLKVDNVIYDEWRQLEDDSPEGVE